MKRQQVWLCFVCYFRALTCSKAKAGGVGGRLACETHSVGSWLLVSSKSWPLTPLITRSIKSCPSEGKAQTLIAVLRAFALLASLCFVWASLSGAASVITAPLLLFGLAASMPQNTCFSNSAPHITTQREGPPQLPRTKSAHAPWEEAASKTKLC